MSESWPEVISVQNENKHEIVLSGNAISDRIKKNGLDSTVFKLTALNYLTIKETCLNSVPSDLSNLVNLQTLVLHTNNLESLPIEIGKLKKLKTLDISSNKLESIPSEISELNQLTVFNASSNVLKSLPSFEKNTKLSVLDLTNNNLKDFPDVCYGELAHLSEIKLGKNVIEEIPLNIKVLPALKILDLSSNKITSVPGELSDLAKLKEIDLKKNNLSDKRLVKMIDQCHSKQIIEYIRQHCSRSGDNAPTKGGKKGKKGQNTKKDDQNKPDDEKTAILSHKLYVTYVGDSTPNVQIYNDVKSVRPHILCCIVKGIKFSEQSFKKFIQLQTKLHDTICDKRNAATIATHDLEKIATGDLIYTAKNPDDLKILPLSRKKIYSGTQLFNQLQVEADNLRKEKKRNVYSGIHKFLYLLEGKPVYPCLMDSTEQVISFPPITNSDVTKISVESKAMFLEVTSSASQGVCRKILDTLLREMILLGISDTVTTKDEAGEGPKYYSLIVEQVKIVDPEGNLKSVYPSRTDLDYEQKDIVVVRDQN